MKTQGFVDEPTSEEAYNADQRICLTLPFCHYNILCSTRILLTGLGFTAFATLFGSSGIYCCVGKGCEIIIPSSAVTSGVCGGLPASQYAARHCDDNLRCI